MAITAEIVRKLREKTGAGMMDCKKALAETAGDFAKGERGVACLPGREGEFQAGVGKAIEYAKALKCPQVNCLVGLTPAGVPADKVRQTLVANLRFAAAALAKAQSQIHGAIKDSTNPFFNSRYADLASVWEACRGPLTANGLAIVQTPSATFSGDAHIEQVTGKSGEKRSVLRSLATVTVVTALVHSSGEFIAGDVSAIAAMGARRGVPMRKMGDPSRGWAPRRWAFFGNLIGSTLLP